MGEISVLSLNTFGIPFYLGWGRLNRLTSELNRSAITALCLQEVQQNAYSPLIKRGLKSYPHQIDERHKYAPKGGLAIFSRLPFTHYNFEVYKNRGAWLSISVADWALYKGILSANFEVDGLPVVIMNTHMNANYSGIWNRANPMSQIQASQVQQLSAAIQSVPEEALVIVCGDLNFPKSSFLYEDLITQNNLSDPLSADQRPSYRPFPLVPSSWKISIDYALVRRPAGKDIRVIAEVVEIEDTTKKLAIQRFLTDHNALTLKINWD